MAPGDVEGAMLVDVEEDLQCEGVLAVVRLEKMEESWDRNVEAAGPVRTKTLQEDVRSTDRVRMVEEMKRRVVGVTIYAEVVRKTQSEVGEVLPAEVMQER